MHNVAVNTGATKTKAQGKAPSKGLAFPYFDMPKFEVPAQFREFAEKGGAQARANCEKAKAAAEEMADVFEETYSAAARGTTDYALKIFDLARVNVGTALDFTSALMSAKSPAELIELSTGHARRQFEILSEQSKELTGLAQKIAANVVEPIAAAAKPRSGC